MIKIGDFARLSQVSVVTLRYYDEMDLLKPVKVDTLFHFNTTYFFLLLSGRSAKCVKQLRPACLDRYSAWSASEIICFIMRLSAVRFDVKR